jgi:hypothetical protein
MKNNKIICASSNFKNLGHLKQLVSPTQGVQNEYQ